MNESSGRFDRAETGLEGEAPDWEALASRLRQVVGEGGVRENEPLSKHTTFEIGGPARLFVVPGDPGEVGEALALCREANVKSFILGAGSDLLVADEGYDGVIVALAEGLLGMAAEGDRLVCQAGVPIARASEMACELGLSGLEFACGIPGSVGGACFMNAGAYNGCVADVLESARVLCPDGSVRELGVGELDLGYRKSRIADEGLVVLSATFALRPADRESIRATMDDLTRRREEKQPLELPSAGSTFKRPEGYFAGKLIMDAGLMGYQVGGAAVSTKHAGFVVNLGGATAADVQAVIAHVQDEVERASGVRLEPEVRFLG